MASFNPQKIELSQINGGVRYEDGDGIQADSINNAIEASAFAQSLATNQPDTSGASEVGTPSVSITYGADGTPRFSFKSLKGIKGDSGVGDAKLLNEVGESDTDGYTQKTTNSLISNPNLLINGDFQVWQRGESFSKTKTKYYSADRWYAEFGDGTSTTTKTSDGMDISVSITTAGISGIVQKLELNPFLLDKKVTFSCLVKSSQDCYGLVRYKKISTNTNTTIDRTNHHTGDGTWQLLTVTVDLSSLDASDVGEIAVKIQSASTTQFNATIKYAKLEVGSIATPLTPRPYAEELAMCQRYYQVFENSTKFLGYTDGTNYAKAIIPTIAKMRDNPTVSMSSKGQVIVGNSGYEVGSFSFNSYSGNNLILSLLLISTVNSSFALYESSSSITLDAEIY